MKYRHWFVDSIENGVASRPERRAKKPSKLASGAKTALEALGVVVKAHGTAAEPSEHVPCGAKVVSLELWREHAFKLGISGSNDAEI